MSETIPIVEYLVLDPEPHLVANECTNCAARFFDRRNACASCGNTEFRQVSVSNTGEVRAFTIVSFAAPGVPVPFVAAVAPGFDDRTIRVPGTLVPRDGGATYDATWRAALAVDPAWVLVASWNEWHEGSEIEPSIEQGRRYLDATRERADRFRQGIP